MQKSHSMQNCTVYALLLNVCPSYMHFESTLWEKKLRGILGIWGPCRWKARFTESSFLKHLWEHCAHRTNENSQRVCFSVMSVMNRNMVWYSTWCHFCSLGLWTALHPCFKFRLKQFSVTNRKLHLAISLEIYNWTAPWKGGVCTYFVAIFQVTRGFQHNGFEVFFLLGMPPNSDYSQCTVFCAMIQN